MECHRYTWLVCDHWDLFLSTQIGEESAHQKDGPFEVDVQAQGRTVDITKVRITLVDDPKLKAHANITLDDCVEILGMKVIQGESGLFLALPALTLPRNGCHNVAYPKNNKTRKWVEDIVLKKYAEEIERRKKQKDE